MKNYTKYSQKTDSRIRFLYAAASILFIVSAIIGLLIGSTAIGITDFLSALKADLQNSPEVRILLFVRLPRVLSALLCGGALAVSGAVIQAVLANPLASPSIIGVNAGAGLAVTLSAALGVIGGFGMSLSAFIGAFSAVLIVSLAAKKWGASKESVVLIGAALNSLLGAISDTVITVEPTVSILSSQFKIGDLSFVSYQRIIPAAVIILPSIAILFTLSNELDVFSLGEESAKSLGLNTALMRTVFLLLAALLAGCAVSMAGLLSFIGLLVPHAVRRLMGGKNGHLLPLCALFGGGFVCLSDTLSRVLFAPYEIPVGIIMAFIGAPFFVFILVKRSEERFNA